MLTVLLDILCILEHLAAYGLLAIVDAVNGIIAGAAAGLAAMLVYLPSLPAWPSSESGWWSWLNWIIPVSSIVAIGTALVTLFVAYFAVRIALRWVKAL